mgnify:CR=1 FL=1
MGNITEMNSIKEIAERLADIIINPNSAIGFAEGALSVPLDFGYLVWGVFDTDSRYHRETERIRLLAAVRRGFLNYEQLKEAIALALTEFEKRLTKKKKDGAYSKTVFSLIGRASANSYITTKITAAIIERVTFFVKMRNSIFLGNLLLLAGMAERSIRTSQQLAINNPEIYEVLRPCDSDLLYFLFESSITPFAQALQVRREPGEPAFDHLIDLANKKINGY